MDKRHNLKMGDPFLDHLFNTPLKKSTYLTAQKTNQNSHTPFTKTSI